MSMSRCMHGQMAQQPAVTVNKQTNKCKLINCYILTSTFFTFSTDFSRLVTA